MGLKPLELDLRFGGKLRLAAVLSKLDRVPVAGQDTTHLRTDWPEAQEYVFPT